MADYTRYELKLHVNIQNKQSLVLRALDWMCNSSAFGVDPPEIDVNPRWLQMHWGANKYVFNKHTGYLHILSQDGCRGNPIPDFFEFMRPEIVSPPGTVVGWYVCESDNVKHALVV